MGIHSTDAVYSVLVSLIMDQKLKQIIISTLMELEPKEISVFGSYARGDQRDDSDIDVLIEYHKAPTLFEVARTILKFEKLNLVVDLVFKNNLNDDFYNEIEPSLITIYQNVKQSA